MTLAPLNNFFPTPAAIFDEFVFSACERGKKEKIDGFEKEGKCDTRGVTSDFKWRNINYSKM